MERSVIIEQQSSSKIGWRISTMAVFTLALLLIGLWNLAGPGMWWDEGWTLSVARNVVEHGHYGRLLDGQLAPPGLEASFVVTAPVALSFRLFGVGLWQGRLPGVVFMILSLGFIYELARQLYNRRVALGTLFVLLLTSMHPQLHPLFMGRQVLAEVPMAFFLLVGYLCFALALTRTRWFLILAILGWGVGIISKAQAEPFWAVSLLIPLLVCLIQRQWKIAASTVIGIVGTLIVSRLLIQLVQIVLQGHTLPTVPIHGVYEVLAVVLVPFNRLIALQITLLFGLSTVLGLCYAAWRYLRPGDAPPAASVQTVRLSLLMLSGSWFAWYLLLSVGVPRYLFPATFFGSPFVAVLFYDLSEGYNLRLTLSRAIGLLKRRFNRQTGAAWLVIVLLALTVPITLSTLDRYYLNNTNTDAFEVADFLNTQTPPNARIETYESELHFLLNRSYHYPPDQLHVDLNHRSLLQEDVTIDYDPLADNPDYLVVGQFASGNELYKPVIASGAFRLLFHKGNYDVYQRVR